MSALPRKTDIAKRHSQSAISMSAKGQTPTSGAQWNLQRYGQIDTVYAPTSRCGAIYRAINNRARNLLTGLDKLQWWTGL